MSAGSSAPSFSSEALPILVAPSDRVFRSLIRSGDEVPEVVHDQLKKALRKEREKIPRGFLVAYHCLPDASSSSAVVLYEFNAEIAQLVYGVDVPVLPRLIKKHFEGPWGKVKTMQPLFSNDHKVLTFSTLCFALILLLGCCSYFDIRF